jgi:hypothetical protein
MKSKLIATQLVQELKNEIKDLEWVKGLKEGEIKFGFEIADEDCVMGTVRVELERYYIQREEP